MASITSTASLSDRVYPITWRAHVREALAVPGFVLILKEYFDPEVANALLDLDCVPAADKKELKSFLKHSAKDRKSGLQCARGEYSFSARCKVQRLGASMQCTTLPWAA